MAVLMLAVVLAIQGAHSAEIEGILSDAAKRLEGEYFHAIKGEDLGPPTNKVIAQNSDVLTLESLRPSIEAHNAF